LNNKKQNFRDLLIGNNKIDSAYPKGIEKVTFEQYALLVLILIELTMMINSDSFRSDFNPNN
jgi:hypothetical protein